MAFRLTTAILAATALISSSAAAGHVPCARYTLLTDACCTGDDDGARDQAEVDAACCCDVTPVTGEPVAPQTSGVVQVSTDVPQAAAAAAPPVPDAEPDHALSFPPAHARGPPGPSADLLTQRTSLQR